MRRGAILLPVRFLEAIIGSKIKVRNFENGFPRPFLRGRKLAVYPASLRAREKTD
jgi:hypothetical protein